MGSFTTTHPIDTTIVASTPISGQSIGFLRTTMLLPTVSANFASDGVASTIEINDTTANGPVLSDSDKYGSSIANIGDLNGDGVDDIAVGAYFDDNGGTNRGALHIHFMNTNGSIDSTVEINDATANGPVLADNDQYGFSIANMGDLNGDGVQDIAVGANLDDNGGTDRGALHIHFMNTDGSIDSTVEINDSTTNGPPPLANTDQYGFSVANMGDLNGDGVQDIAVGANLDDDAGTNRGAVYISFLNTDGSIDSTVAINDATTNGPVLANADEYGSSVANIGDLNGDGVQDLASGGT
jgi:FG-GAP repeat